MKLTKLRLKQIIKEELGSPSRARFHDVDTHPYIQSAYALYQAMEGLGTDEQAIEEVINYYTGFYGLLRLEQAFNNLPEVKTQKEKYGGLVEWLVDDGMHESAAKIKDAHSDPQYDELAAASSKTHKAGPDVRGTLRDPKSGELETLRVHEIIKDEIKKVFKS